MRGAQPADTNALRRDRGVSSLVQLGPEIRELDINPLTVLSEGAVAVDAGCASRQIAAGAPSRRISIEMTEVMVQCARNALYLWQRSAGLCRTAPARVTCRARRLGISVRADCTRTHRHAVWSGVLVSVAALFGFLARHL